MMQAKDNKQPITISQILYHLVELEKQGQHFYEGTVRLKKKVHLPTLFELPWMKETTYLPWMNAAISFNYASVS